MEEGTIKLPTGEVVSRTDVDALLRIHEQCRQVGDTCANTRRIISCLLLEMTPDTDSRTRRVEGTQFRGEVQAPGIGFNHKKLLALWEKHPAVRDRLLRIESIGVKLREYRKLLNSALPGELSALVKAVYKAETGPSGNPRVAKVEKIEHGADESFARPGQAGARTAETG